MNCYPDENADPEEELDEHLKAELEWEAEMRAEENALRAESSDPASGMIQAVSMLDAKLQASLAREAALQLRLNEADQRTDAYEVALAAALKFTDDLLSPAKVRSLIYAASSQLTKDSPEVGS